MRRVDLRRSALVAHPAARIFAVIEAAEDYPDFLPWCAGATILERDEQVVSARIQVAWRGVRFSFVTRNPKRAPEWMAIGLKEGPFRRFEGQWQLTPLAEWGCRVEFTLSYEMNSALLGALAGPVFDHMANTLVDAFIERADRVAAGVAQVSAHARVGAADEGSGCTHNTAPGTGAAPTAAAVPSGGSAPGAADAFAARPPGASVPAAAPHPIPPAAAAPAPQGGMTIKPPEDPS